MPRLVVYQPNTIVESNSVAPTTIRGAAIRLVPGARPSMLFRRRPADNAASEEEAVIHRLDRAARGSPASRSGVLARAGIRKNNQIRAPFRPGRMRGRREASYRVAHGVWTATSRTNGDKCPRQTGDGRTGET